MESPAGSLPPRSWIPNTTTAANIAVGFSSMLLAANGRFDQATYLLALAIFLDAMDGRLARRLGATSSFGQQLDSFSDVISFGAAPALLVFQACLFELGFWGMLVALAYLLAGVYRLTRFNLLADAHSKAAKTVGVPIPIGAGYLMATVLMRDQLATLWAAAVVLFMAFGMASRWRLPDLKGRSAVSAMLLVGLANYVAVVVSPNWYTVVWWNVWNVLILLVARSRDRRLGLDASET